MNNDHRIADQPLAYRGYQAFAPTTILTRLLANYSEVGLSDEQEKITYFERIRVPLRHTFESAMSILQ